jgi:4-aminobutyrate aminotransferase/(S)-3-amino-2-methylpropionate transaminase
LKNVEPQSVAAIIVEPFLGEGGFIPFPNVYLQRLVEFCRDNGILLIADEIQTGWARTGKLFGIQHYDIEPDILVTAKSLAGGLPLAAITVKAEIVDTIHKGGLGGTFSGNPVCCAAALGAIKAIEEENLVARAEAIGEKVRARFRAFYEKFPLVGDVRGLGAMNALELVKDRTSKKPAAEEVLHILKHCYQHGLIVLKAGTYGNCVRTLMPLVISDQELDEGLDILEEALEALGSNPI